MKFGYVCGGLSFYLLHKINSLYCPGKILGSDNESVINYNIWILLYLVMKKIKHKVVETMSSGTADALGLSRAILCNGINIYLRH